MAKPDPRADKAERRTRLRALDATLAGEVMDAGSSTLDELSEEVERRDLLGVHPTPATLAEWWEYAVRRGLLGEADENGRRAISESGRNDLAIRATEWEGRSGLQMLRDALRWLVPSGAVVIAAVALAANNDDVVSVLGIILAFLVLLVPGLWIVDLLVARLDPVIVRKVQKAAVAFLDGQEIRVGLRQLSVKDPQRLYSTPAIGK